VSVRREMDAAFGRPNVPGAAAADLGPLRVPSFRDRAGGAPR
jgi:hypothetical protein